MIWGEIEKTSSGVPLIISHLNFSQLLFTPKDCNPSYVVPLIFQRGVRQFSSNAIKPQEEQRDV